MTYLKKLGLAGVAAVALMAFAGAGSASATTLEVNGVAQGGSVAFSLTLEPSTSILLKDSLGTTADTCTEASINGSTESPFTGATVTGSVTILIVNKCTHTWDILAKGKIHFAWISSTTNATVSLSGVQWTILSTAFGISATCNTGAGTDIGVLTGATTTNNPSDRATLDLNGKVSCGILGSASLTASFVATSPTDLGFVN